MILSRIVDAFSQRSLNNPAVPLNSARAWEYLAGETKTSSGVSVTPAKILGVSAVWKAVTILSGDISTLPLLLYRRLEQGKERATDHPLYRTLKRHVGTMSVFLWKRRTIAQAALYNNSYSRIIRDPDGSVRFVLGHPDRVRPYLVDEREGITAYEWKARDGRKETIPASEVLHVQGLSMDELGGLSIIEYARNTIGRIIATETFGDDFLANSGLPLGWFTTPATMTDPARDRFIQQVQKIHGGQGKRHGLGVLEEGMQWVQASVSPEDAMLVDLLKLAPEDVARIMNVPPHKLGVQGAVKLGSLEQENMDYVQSSLGPFLESIQSEAGDKLLTEEEQSEEPGGMFAEFLLDARMRADTLARFQSHRLAVSSRIVSPNEVRAMENMNPYEGGDTYINPYTVATAGGVLVGDTSTVGGDNLPADDSPARDEAQDARELRVLDAAFEQVHKRLCAVVESATTAEKRTKLLAELSAKHREVVYRTLLPAISLVVRDDGVSIAEFWTEAWLTNTASAISGGRKCVDYDMPSIRQNILEQRSERWLSENQIPSSGISAV